MAGYQGKINSQYNNNKNNKDVIYVYILGLNDWNYWFKKSPLFDQIERRKWRIRRFIKII